MRAAGARQRVRVPARLEGAQSNKKAAQLKKLSGFMPFTDTPIGATPRRSETGHALPMYHGRARLSSPPGTKNPARSRPKPLQRVARQGEPQEGREKRDPCSGGRSPPNRATRSPEPPAGAAGRGGAQGRTQRRQRATESRRRLRHAPAQRAAAREHKKRGPQGRARRARGPPSGPRRSPPGRRGNN